MKKTIFTICLLAITALSFGQYTLNLPSFNSNPMLYNPAYAGSTETFDASILYSISSRYSTDIDENFSLLSMSSPIGKGSWSIGGNLMYEQFHYINFSSVDATVAYHKNLKNDVKLSLGALTSLERHHFDNTLGIFQGFEPIFEDVAYTPQFGLGAIYQTQRGYLSVSMPNMFRIPFTYEDRTGNEYYGESQTDLYISVGLNAVMFNDKLQILPSAVYHKPQSSELIGYGINNLELGASFVLFEKVWISGAYRLAFDNVQRNISVDYADIRVGVNLKNGLRVSSNLEFPLSELNGVYYSTTTSSIMLGYRVSNGTENPYMGRRNFF